MDYEIDSNDYCLSPIFAVAEEATLIGFETERRGAKRKAVLFNA